MEKCASLVAMRKIEARNRGYVLLFLLVLLDSLSPSLSLSPSGFIQRESNLQILASLPPATSGSAQQFLASPSGKFAAYFVRSGKSGGFGSDFCYIEVEGGGQSFSNAGCTEIGDADTCTLVFSDSGLEIYDGNRSGWNSDGSSDHPDALILLDSGELMMKTKEGESPLKVTDSSKEAPQCRTTSGNTPGLFFSDPNNGDSEQGQQQGEEGEEGQGNQQQGIFPGFNQPFSSQNQPFSSQNQPFSNQNQPFSNQNQPFSNFNQPFSSQNPSFGNGNGQPFQNNNAFENGVSDRKAKVPLLVAVSLISLMAALTVLLY